MKRAAIGLFSVAVLSGSLAYYANSLRLSPKQSKQTEKGLTRPVPGVADTSPPVLGPPGTRLVFQ